MIQILAILSASAASGMRIGLPLMMVGLAYSGQLWSNFPILSAFKPQVIVAVLTSLTLFELWGTKKIISLRIIQLMQLFLSPIIGSVMAIGVARLIDIQFTPLWIIGLTGGLFAFLLKVVQVGWFFRLGKMPIYFVFAEDILSAILVVFALKAPENGGLIAMLLLWLALRSATAWKNWHDGKSNSEIGRN